MKKKLGFILMGIGVIGLLFSTPQIRDPTGLVLPTPLTENIILVISLVVLGVGGFLTIERRTTRGPVEVPIYHGKDIVGFRRVHNK